MKSTLIAVASILAFIAAIAVVLQFSFFVAVAMFVFSFMYVSVGMIKEYLRTKGD